MTFAGRLMHFGRYGGDAESPLMRDLSVGYPSLVRGYEPGSFTAADCAVSSAQSISCPAFDRLFGSRMAVANAELRLSLTGYRGFLSKSGLPPIEIASFVMIHVGYEFEIDRSRLSSYDLDYGVAATVAALPWLFFAAWFVFAMHPAAEHWTWST